MVDSVVPIGALDYLGFKKQAARGAWTAPTNPAAVAGEWVEWITKATVFHPGWKVVRTGSAQRGTARRRGRGRSFTDGSFEIPLLARQGMPLVAGVFGKDTFTATSNGSGFAGTATQVAGVVTTVTITTPGTGYPPGTYLRVNGATGGAGAIVTVTVTGGVLSAPVIVQGGENYSGALTLQAVAPQTHVFNPQGLQQLWSLYDVRGGTPYQVRDVKFTQMELVNNNGDLQLRFTLLGSDGGTKDTTSFGSPSTAPAFIGYDDTVFNWAHITQLLAPGANALGTPVPARIPAGNVTNMGLTFNNNSTQIFGAGSPYATIVGDRTWMVTGTMTWVFDNQIGAVAFANFIAGVEEHLSMTVSPNSGVDSHVIDLPQALFTEEPITTPLDDYVTVTATFECLQPENVNWTSVNSDSNAYV
jgi:hypothetical protein